jgi:high-affinity iron transporter
MLGSRRTVVLDSAILVFREGLETMLVLAAIVASFRGANSFYRRPVAAGSGMATAAGVATWFGVIWLIGRFHGSELTIQAATGLPALLVLLLVMNWFFHKVYWTGWISHHNQSGCCSQPPWACSRLRCTSACLTSGC